MSTLVSSLVYQPLVLRAKKGFFSTVSPPGETRKLPDPHEYSKQAGETGKITLDAEHDCPSRIHSRDIQRDNSVNFASASFPFEQLFEHRQRMRSSMKHE